MRVAEIGGCQARVRLADHFTHSTLPCCSCSVSVACSPMRELVSRLMTEKEVSNAEAARVHEERRLSSAQDPGTHGDTVIHRRTER